MNSIEAVSRRSNQRVVVGGGLCTSTTQYRKGFSKPKFDITIYNIQQLICHNQGGENIH